MCIPLARKGKEKRELVREDELQRVFQWRAVREVLTCLSKIEVRVLDKYGVRRG